MKDCIAVVKYKRLFFVLQTVVQCGVYVAESNLNFKSCVFISSPFFFLTKARVSIVWSPVLGESAGGMVHTLPTSGFTFSKAETATLGLALLVLLAALLLGVVLVAVLYCLLIR